MRMSAGQAFTLGGCSMVNICTAFMFLAMGFPWVFGGLVAFSMFLVFLIFKYY